MAKMIVVHEERCLACKTCVVQCALVHSDARDLAEAVRMTVPPQARIHVEPVGECAMPLQCRHCEDAPCVIVCPTQAIYRYDQAGPVLLDGARCIGCKFCLLACPFGVIDLTRDGKAAVKCDLCAARAGAAGEPACVASCPTGALEFVEADDFLRRRRRQAAEHLAEVGRRGKVIAEGGNDR